MLGALSAVKELLGRSAAEIVYRTTLRLPGKFSHKYNIDAHTDIQITILISSAWPYRVSVFAHRATQLRTTFSNISKSTHAHIIVRSGRVLIILVKGKVETVSLDRVKPARLDNEPAIGTEKQCKTQNNMKNSKNTATV